MKIRQLTSEIMPKAEALLSQAFSGSTYEVQLFQNLHKNNKEIYDWVCIHRNSVAGYIAFTNAYMGKEKCGLHLAPLAVKPEMQLQGVGSELLRFALRQEAIRDQTLFVLGESSFYTQFGFEPCRMPICFFDKNNKHFFSIRNTFSEQFVVGYESEFHIGM